MGGKIVLVFLLGFVIDLFYVVYVNAVRDRHKLKAGAASVMLAAPALLGFMSILEEKLLMAPYFAGLFFGTITAMTWEDLSKGVHVNPVVHPIDGTTPAEHSGTDDTH